MGGVQLNMGSSYREWGAAANIFGAIAPGRCVGDLDYVKIPSYVH